MPDLIEVFTHWQAGDSLRNMAQNLGMDRQTLRKYLTAATAAGITRVSQSVVKGVKRLFAFRDDPPS